MRCIALVLILLTLAACRSKPTEVALQTGPLREVFPPVAKGAMPPPASDDTEAAAQQPSGRGDGAAGADAGAPPGEDAAASTAQASGGLSPDASGAGERWPRTFSAPGGVIRIYQPQLESWDGFTLKAIAAVAVQREGAAPDYGVVGLSARTLVEKRRRMVQLEDIQVTDARFPSAADRQQTYLAVLRRAAPSEVQSIALDRLEAGLVIAQSLPGAPKAQFKNDPPKVIFSAKPAFLVYIDGPAKYVPVKDTKLTRVLNTRVLLLRDAEGRHYLHFLDGYLQAAALDGPYTVAKAPPPGAAQAEAAARATRQVDFLEGRLNPETGKGFSLTEVTAPRIVVATMPTELIVTKGVPEFEPIPGAGLSYVTNTSGNVFRNAADNSIYVLLAGRFFRSASFDGPWSYVPGNQLPKGFAAIPDESPKENVKAVVPGTRQAREATVANSIPTIKRVSRASPPVLRMTLDGDPVLKPIQGTELNYVANASVPVIQVDINSWYACQNAVWFTGPTVTGPWKVADSVPEGIYAIPPSSPLYHAIHTKVYGSTADDVYYGYSPGYLGTGGTGEGVTVFGTGYQSTPPPGNVWYGPGSVGYGVGAAPAWNPAGGWGYQFGVGWGGGDEPWYPAAPWWGPYNGWSDDGYGGVTAWEPGGAGSTSADLYGPRDGAQPPPADFNQYAGNARANQYGRAYNSTTGALISGPPGAVANVHPSASTTLAERADDLYASPDGIVYRRSSDGTFQAINAPSAATNPSVQNAELERHKAARDIGEVRAQSVAVHGAPASNGAPQ